MLVFFCNAGCEVTPFLQKSWTQLQAVKWAAFEIGGALSALILRVLFERLEVLTALKMNARKVLWKCSTTSFIA